MNLVLTTLASYDLSRDDFSNYLPLYQYCAAKFLPDWHTRVFTQGGICDKYLGKAYEILKEALPQLEEPVGYIAVPAPGVNNEKIPGFSGLARFLHLEWRHFKNLNPKYILITDADLLLFQDPLSWHLLQMQTLGCYAGHHGAVRKPYRPELTGPNAWRGEFERVAGGFLLVTKEWFEKTAGVREKYASLLWRGKLKGYREMDEVVLCKILKESGLPVPVSGMFPQALRGLHLGDFKDTMTHRWTDMTKMLHKLSQDNCMYFRQLETDPVWQELLRALNPECSVLRILGNVRKHLEERGM